MALQISRLVRSKQRTTPLMRLHVRLDLPELYYQAALINPTNRCLMLNSSLSGTRVFHTFCPRPGRADYRLNFASVVYIHISHRYAGACSRTCIGIHTVTHKRFIGGLGLLQLQNFFIVGRTGHH
jgi:hypothetical protein